MLAEILNKVKRLYTDFNTNSRIAKLDALGLPSGKIVPNGTDDWTSARAGYLTTINSRLPASTIASSSEVAKVGDGWNQALAIKLAAIKQPVCASAKVLISSPSMQSVTSNAPVIGGQGLSIDGVQGIRYKVHENALANSWEDVANETGGGHLLCAFVRQAYVTTQWVNFRIVIDGFTLYERVSTTTVAQNSAYIPVGYVSSSSVIPVIYPIRFNSQLLIQVRGSSVGGGVFGVAAYLQD